MESQESQADGGLPQERLLTQVYLSSFFLFFLLSFLLPIFAEQLCINTILGPQDMLVNTGDF